MTARLTETSLFETNQVAITWVNTLFLVDDKCPCESPLSPSLSLKLLFAEANESMFWLMLLAKKIFISVS